MLKKAILILALGAVSLSGTMQAIDIVNNAMRVIGIESPCFNGRVDPFMRLSLGPIDELAITVPCNGKAVVSSNYRDVNQMITIDTEREIINGEEHIAITIKFKFIGGGIGAVVTFSEDDDQISFACSGCLGGNIMLLLRNDYPNNKV